MLFHGFFHSFNLDQQHGRRVHGISGVHVLFDATHHPAIQHLQRCRGHAALRDRDHRVRRVLHRIVNSQQRSHGFRHLGQLDRDARGNSHGAFRADKKPCQIQTAGILCFATELHNAPIREHDFQTGDVVDGHAHGQRVWSAGIFGNVAADRAGFLAGRIGRVIISVLCRGVAYFKVDHSGLDHGALVVDVNFKDLVHAR